MKVKIFSVLREFVGQKEVELQLETGSTILDVLNAIAGEYSKLKPQIFDEDHNMKSSIIVLINGRNIRFLSNLDTSVNEDDQVAIFPIVGGG
jgi:molybdopterin synthase sulfur carrier subunit